MAVGLGYSPEGLVLQALVDYETKERLAQEWWLTLELRLALKLRLALE